MKVLLFVQNGNARPKVAHANCPDSISRRSGQRVRDAIATKGYLSNVQLRLSWGLWAVQVRAAGRWWLVECESAAEGRRTIRNADTPCDCETYQCKHGTFGDILASGGRGESCTSNVVGRE